MALDLRHRRAGDADITVGALCDLGRKISDVHEVAVSHHDGTLHRVKEGDLVALPAGTGICHTFLNDGPHEATILVGGEANKPANRIFYPHHPQRRAQLAPEDWWADIPLAPQGPHDGKPRG